VTLMTKIPPDARPAFPDDLPVNGQAIENGTHARNANLQTLRLGIDELDTALLKLLAQRAELVRQVGLYKHRNQLPPLDENRWQQVMDKNLEEGLQYGLSPAFVESVYTLIHQYSLQLEQQYESLNHDESP
jgi:chorismate mutase